MQRPSCPRRCWVTATTFVFGTVALAAPQVQIEESTPEVGERVVVQYSETAGSGTDWVGIYEASASDFDYLYWLYTNGSQNPGPPGLTEGELTFLPMSLPPGDYEARLFFNDSYVREAAVAFDVISAAASPPPDPVGDLTLMSFNIWVDAQYGFGGVPAVVDAIRKTGADVIGLQECGATTLDAILDGLKVDERYAEAQSSAAASVISRYSIVDTYTAGLSGYGVKIQLPDGEFIRFFNSHLTAYPYGPYSVRDGRTNQQVMQDELATRASEMRDILRLLIEAPPNEPELTTFLVGDHNTPSHLDWIAENAEQNFGRVIRWPVSRVLAARGFVDAFREIHPDPVVHRGLSWSPGYPKNSLTLDDVHDRIDIIYHRQGVGHSIVTLQAYTLDEDPWPADHRAMVASLGRSAR